jgi:hypothetical protein
MTSPLPCLKQVCATLVLLAACQVNAQSVDIKWGSDQRFARSVKVTPTQPYEFCKSLTKGQKLLWSFESSQPLTYTVYSVEGSEKTPLGPAASGWKSSGKVGKPSDEARFCWSWTNSSGKPIELAFDIKLDP